MPTFEAYDAIPDADLSEARFFGRQDLGREILVRRSRDEHHLELAQAYRVQHGVQVGGEWGAPEDQAIGARLAPREPAGGGGSPLGEAEDVYPDGVPAQALENVVVERIEVLHVIGDFSEAIFAGHPARADFGGRTGGAGGAA